MTMLDGIAVGSTEGHAVRRVGTGTKVRAALLGAGLVSGIAFANIVPASGASAFAVKASCGATSPGVARCLALRVVSGAQHTSAQASGPAGWHPADLQAAYNLDITKGAGQTVGIVDAYDDPNAESEIGRAHV